MLLNLTELIKKYNLKIKGVVQVGCHFGQEMEEYISHGIKNMVFIEPCENAFNTVSKKVGAIEGIKLFNCACGDFESESEPMYAESTNQGMSNSLLKPKVHLTQHKEVIFDHTETVMVRRLDNLEFDRSLYNLLNMDCQGFEDRVLKGASETLKHIDYIYTEVNRLEMYENNAMVEQIDEILSDFKRVETGWASDYHGWGDAAYIRKALM